MKRIAIIIIALLLVCSGCAAIQYNVNTAQQDVRIQSEFTRIDGYENLYYSKTTLIVYWISGSANFNTSYITVYYAKNGMPYKYNPLTERIETIKGQNTYESGNEK